MSANDSITRLGERRIKSRKKIRICIKCGSTMILREEDDMFCKECGAVVFF
ncbi:MAG: hypothetical protein KGI11_09350 [Thaumarchaeota archaeon]|nr:hypothetical protein [Nitrososphaerota archaeon]